MSDKLIPVYVTVNVAMAVTERDYAAGNHFERLTSVIEAIPGAFDEGGDSSIMDGGPGSPAGVIPGSPLDEYIKRGGMCPECGDAGRVPAYPDLVESGYPKATVTCRTCCGECAEERLVRLLAELDQLTPHMKPDDPGAAGAMGSILDRLKELKPEPKCKRCHDTGLVSGMGKSLNCPDCRPERQV